MQEVIRFHTSEMRKTSYPCDLNVEMLKNMSSACHFFPPLSGSSVFFVIDDKPRLPELEYPVIKHLTLLKPIDTIQLDKFIRYLRKFCHRFLLLVESYNLAALDMIKRLSHQETYYCQQKLLCYIDGLNIDWKRESCNVSIRNFIAGKDEARYAAFYNEVLGFLAGKPVDKSFVDEIVARQSFDPRGYFIAEVEGKIIGFLSIEKEPWGTPGSGFGYIYQIGVAEGWQGSGLATLLLKTACDYAFKKGINRIGVGVRRSNLAAVKFFMKHGFNVAYEVSGYLVDLGGTSWAVG